MISEQVSHHPPVSAFIYAYLDSNVVIEGYISPRAGVNGAGISCNMKGKITMKFFTDKGCRSYTANYPSIYAKNVLIGETRILIAGNISISEEFSGSSCTMKLSHGVWHAFI
jgi:hypothetical protein